MVILLWLVPAAVATLLAMAWAGWAGREGRGEVDRDVAVRRMGEALSRPVAVRRRVPPRPRERSTGVAVRRRAAGDADAGVEATDGAGGVSSPTRRSA